MQSVVRTEMPMDGAVWCLQWMGHPLYGELLTEPQIPLLFVKEGTENAEEPIRHKCTIGVGSLPVLTIGSRWKNGKRAGRSEPANVSTSVLFEPQVCLPITAGARLEDSPPRYLIPPYKHSLGPGDWLHTKCLVLPATNGQVELVVPCWEVLRAWYFRSRALISRLISGPLELTMPSLFRLKWARNEHGKRVSSIFLRSGLFEADGVVAAMLAFHEPAQRRLSMALESIFRSQAGDVRSALVAYPPEAGPQNIVASGKWITAKAPRRFLVYRLKEIQYPSSVKYVDFNFDNDGRSDGKKNRKLPRSRFQQKPVPVPGEGELEMYSRKEPSRRRRAALETYRPPLFINPPEMRRLPIELNKRRAAPPLELLETRHVATAKPGYADGPHGVLEIQPGSELGVRRDPLPAGFDTMVDIAKQISSWSSYECKPVHVGSFSDPNHDLPVSEFPTKEPILGPVGWAQIRRRGRRVLALEIQSDGFFYALEIEIVRDTEHFTLAVVASLDGERVDIELFDDLLLTCASARGVWPREFPGLQIKKLKHTRPTVGEFAAAIVESGSELLGLSSVPNFEIERLDQAQGKDI